jgi:CBS domain-containing protein
VVDDEERPIGVITVDDVLELVIPPPADGWGSSAARSREGSSRSGRMR